ncbi:MAG: chemotaxis-specific protein-glutamate methyltransferase CheB [Sulfitobacter sp.]
MTEFPLSLPAQVLRANPPKRVAIVDDSATMRRWLRHVLEKDKRLCVVAEASDAQQARAVIKTYKPDVITLDIEMPGMDGLEFLQRLMRLHPLPVVMVSSTTTRGSDAGVRALSLGAVDCLVKPTNTQSNTAQREMCRRVFSAACCCVSAPARSVPNDPHDQAFPTDGPMPIILMGASTGGVAAIETVLRGLHPNGPPVVIVQHMPGSFLVSFSNMLDKKLAQTVGLLRNGVALHRGQIMLAPALDRQHAGVTRLGGLWIGTLTPATGHNPYCPSADALFGSALAYGADVMAVLLTGLGRDGAQGLKDLREAGARTVGQDQFSSTVYGMPRAAWELGAVERQLPLDRIGPALNQLVALHAAAWREWSNPAE